MLLQSDDLGSSMKVGDIYKRHLWLNFDDGLQRVSAKYEQGILLVENEIDWPDTMGIVVYQ